MALKLGWKMESNLELLKVMSLDQLKERQKVMSLVRSSAAQMVMQMVLMMEKHLEKRRDLSWVQLTGMLKELRLVCLKAD